MEIRTIAVIGAGLMGHGIAQEFARAGFDVRLADLSDAALERARENMRRNLRTLADAGLADQSEVESVPASVRTTTWLADAVADADLVVEAITEDLELKRQLFRQLEEHCRDDAILASNTSSFTPTSLADGLAHPERVVVAHYFNPPYLVPLVEVVPSPATAPHVVEHIVALLAGIGKRPVVVRKESVGFIANRMQIALLREALAIVEQGIATLEDVDTVVRNSFGRRLPVAGPFQIADVAGLDVYASAAAAMLPDLASSTILSEILTSRIARGEHGVKTGRGFYDWTAESAEELRRNMAEELMRRPPS